MLLQDILKKQRQSISTFSCSWSTPKYEEEPSASLNRQFGEIPLDDDAIPAQGE